MRPSRRSGHPGSQQFRASRRLASELAQGADLSPVDLVLEFGAGDGRLTAELASRARHVVAIEVDERLAVRLDARFHGDRAVTVVHGDALRTPLPRSTFKVVSNPPFHLTAALLHRLLIRRLDSSTFQPPPATDAAVVSIRRRASPMLPAREAIGFRRWVGRLDACLDVWQLVERYRASR